MTEAALGPDHPEVAIRLNNLGQLYRAQRRYAEAEPFYRRALTIAEATLGPRHRLTAGIGGNLAGIMQQPDGRADQP